jgi:hypothetical protein
MSFPFDPEQGLIVVTAASFLALAAELGDRRDR